METILISASIYVNFCIEISRNHRWIFNYLVKINYKPGGMLLVFGSSRIDCEYHGKLFEKFMNRHDSKYLIYASKR